MSNNETFSVRKLIKRFTLKVIFTQVMMVAETAVNLLIPLFVGFAVNDLVKADPSFEGLIKLAILGTCSMLIGAARRFFDTRIYGGIYVTITNELVDREKASNSSVSKITARVNLLTDFVFFLENIFPEIVNSFVGITGTLIVIFTLSVKVFIGCIIAFAIVVIVYVLTGDSMFKFNKNYNDEKEKDVDIITEYHKPSVLKHFQNVIKWRIKLSDIETFNFTFILLSMVALIIYSIYEIALNGDATQVGTIFASLAYVFEYTDRAAILPFYYGELIKLHEITTRLKET